MYARVNQRNDCRLSHDPEDVSVASVQNLSVVSSDSDVISTIYLKREKPQLNLPPDSEMDENKPPEDYIFQQDGALAQTH